MWRGLFIGKETEMKFEEIIQGLREGRKYYRLEGEDTLILRRSTIGNLEYQWTEQARHEWTRFWVDEEDLEGDWQEVAPWKQVPWHEAIEWAKRNVGKKIKSWEGIERTWEELLPCFGALLDCHGAFKLWYIPAEDTK